MEIPENDNCDFLGLALIDLDDAAPRLAREVAERMGISIEEFIDIALREKLERMEPLKAELVVTATIRKASRQALRRQ
jgi:hypothetical protein